MKFEGGQEVIHLKSDVLIKDLVEDQIQKKLEEERVKEAECGQPANNHATDLIPGVYEGKLNGNYIKHTVTKKSTFTSVSSSSSKSGVGKRVGNRGRRQRRGCGPMSKKRNRKRNEERHPWFNKEMADLIKQREKAHKKWLANDKREKGDANWEIFKKIRNRVSTLRHATRNDFLVAALKVDGFSSAQPWQMKGTLCFKTMLKFFYFNFRPCFTYYLIRFFNCF